VKPWVVVAAAIATADSRCRGETDEAIRI